MLNILIRISIKRAIQYASYGHDIYAISMLFLSWLKFKKYFGKNGGIEVHTVVVPYPKNHPKLEPPSYGGIIVGYITQNKIVTMAYEKLYS